MIREEIDGRARVYLEEEVLLRAAFSGGVVECPWIKVTLRPVLIKAKRVIQFSFYDQRKVIVKNYSGEKYGEELEELMNWQFKNIYVESKKGNLQIMTSKKGKVTVNEDKKMKQTEANMDHNISKKYLIPDDVPSAFLEAVGIMTSGGKVKSDKQNKFRQLNGFLKIIDETFRKAQKALDFQGDLLAVDCGCGNAYLTFATYNYFNQIAGKPLELIGIDINKSLLDGHKAEIEKLKWDKLKFEATKIIDFNPQRSPDLVLSLHACDTATDDALYKAICWDSKMIFASPCCHHNLQKQLDEKKAELEVFTPLLRHGALSERLGDLLTDAFRALILRIMGYQTDVIEFVSAENTNRNLIIRAAKYLKPGDRNYVEEYKKLKAVWKVNPYLEGLLGEKLKIYLDE